MKVKMRSLLTMFLAISLAWIMNGYPLIAHQQYDVMLGLESISFNHDAISNSADAINIRMNYTEDVHVPEWRRGQKSYPAAYIKSKQITVQAVFAAPYWVTSAKIRAFSLHGGLGHILTETVYFNNGQSSPVTFKVSGYTPANIMSFKQKWVWSFKDLNGTKSPGVPFAYSENQIFIVLDVPQSPWTMNGQTEPWVEALEKACNWAKGNTTPEGAAEKITKRLFKNIGGLYDTEWGMPYYPYSFDFSSFALTDFLENIPDVGLVNCYDMGKSLVTLSNVLGCGLSYRYSNPFGYLNCINAIGRGWTNNPFYACTVPEYNINPNPIVPGDSSYEGEGRTWFGNHAFGSIGDYVFDACLTVDTDIDPDDGPPFEEEWMINIPWENYQNKVVDDFPVWNTGTAYPETRPFEIY